MLSKRTHKKNIAALMLVLYVFVATPVSFWHQHTNTKKQAVSFCTDALKITTAEKTVLDTVTEDCAFCDHHYVIYSNDAVAAFQIITQFKRSFQSNYKLIFPLSAQRSYFNKGPPVVA